MIFGNSLQARFIVPVSTFIVVLVLGGALFFAAQENRRIGEEMAIDANDHSASAQQILGVTDTLVGAQTQAAMRLLIERGQALGPATLGDKVKVKDREVANLLLGGRPQANVYDLVDGVVKVVGGTATLFVRDGDDFVRISTNVKRDDQRAIGTVLDPKGRAIAAIREGKAFYGVVDILGNPFLTGYEPIRDSQGKTIGIWYVGYKIDMAALQQAVEKTRLLDSGFLAILDNHGKVRFRSAHASDEQITKVLADDSGWFVKRSTFPAWQFEVVTAYPAAEVEQISRQRMLAIISVGVLACIVLIAMMFVMLRRMVLLPLGGEPTEAAAAAGRIAAGDLATPIPRRYGGDDTLLAAMSRMQGSLVEIVRHIHQGAADLNAASENLATMADNVSRGVSQQNDATAAIAATLEEITVSIRHVSDSAAVVNAKAGDAGTLAEAGNQTVAAAVGEMQRSAESVNQSATRVERLGEGSRQITAIVNVIKEIADQTNLLALNAAIEAARAGEQGRGFAVVADEVRKLAERTAASTQEITGMIAEIQSTTGAVIDGIEDGAGRVNASVDRAVEAGTSMARIHSATSAVVEAVGEISNALREQSAASEVIARNVEQVAIMNEENTVSVRSVVDDAHRLQALAARLKESVGSFRV
jgi:methyl-accepting chemotaxis protein